jgi:hypothetical protein
MARGIGPPRVMVEAFVPQARVACHGSRLSRSRGELARGGDLSCEAETCRVREILIGGGPFYGTGRRCCQLVESLASEGLDRGPQPSSS